jgi:hypothetical protein
MSSRGSAGKAGVEGLLGTIRFSRLQYARQAMSVPNNDRPPQRPSDAIRRKPSADAKPFATAFAPASREKEPAGFNWLWLLLLLPVGLVLAGCVIISAILYFGSESTPPALVAEVQQDPPKKARSPKASPLRNIIKVEEDEVEVTGIRRTRTPPAVEVTITDDSEERPKAKEQPIKVEISGEDTSFVPRQPAGEITVDKKQRVGWQWGPHMEFGITALDSGKLLTYSPNGATNQTLVRINGQVLTLGAGGMLTERDARSQANVAANTFGSSKTTWVYGKLTVTVVLDLVPSKQPVMLNAKQARLLDTVQVRYIFENKDNKAHTIGLRMMLDTLIGGNDGVPFTVPGQTGLVTTFADFPKNGPIPDFIQALEVPNLQNPGTVAHLSLKLGNNIEVPSRVSLTHWGPTPIFDVPLTSLAGDSAVILYWKDLSLKAGGKRTVGFAYGLGSVSSTEPGGKLGLTLGGNFAPGEMFTATAYVQNPVKGQKLTLDLPAGLERVEGQETQTVAAPGPNSNNTTIVTWKVKVLQTGTFPLKVVSNTGQTQTRTISIARAEAEPESKLTVHLSGSFEPGTEFTVEAKLTSGPQPPALLLTLPKDRIVQIGEPTSEVTPSADKKETVTITRWKVKVIETGKHSVRVEATNGLAVTKTVTIVRTAAPTGGDVKLALDGPFAPQKAFTVKAMVAEPLPNQTLTLILPPGLRLEQGKDKMAVPATKESASVVTWKVMVDKPGTYPLGVESSTGITLKKKITIDQREETSNAVFILGQAGDIEAGKEFSLLATVSQLPQGQKMALTLTFPKGGLELRDKPPVRQVTGGSDGAGKTSWRVYVPDKVGTVQMRVESSNGMVRTITITITPAPPPPKEEKRIF